MHIFFSSEGWVNIVWHRHPMKINSFYAKNMLLIFLFFVEKSHKKHTISDCREWRTCPYKLV